MKTKLLFLLPVIYLLNFSGLFGQAPTSGNEITPNNPNPPASQRFGYTFATNLAANNPAVYEWIDISSTGTRISGLGDDNVVGPFSMGLDFKYFWNSYNSVYVGSNGYLMFGSSALIAQGSNGIPNIPVSTDGKGNFIAPMLADLTFVSSANGSPLPGAKILYQTIGNKFVMTFDSVRFWNGNAGNPDQVSGMNTFQVVLDASTNNIQVNYKSCSGPAFTASTGVVTMGMESITGGLGVRWRRLTSGNFNTTGLPAPESATIIRYPASSTFTFVDVQANGTFYNDNKGGTAFTSDSTIIRAYIKNAGTVATTNPCTTRVLITDYSDANDPLYDKSVIVPTLAQGEEKLIEFPIPFFCDSAAGFKVRLSTSMLGDQYTPNNAIQTKLITLDSTQGEFNLKFTRPFPGTLESARASAGGMVLDAPYQPMVVSYTTADLIWPDADGWATLNPDISANDSIAPVRIEVYLGDGPNGSRGSLIDSFTISNDVDYEAEVIGEEFNNGTLINKIIRFKHQLPVPYWWESNQRIYIGAVQNRTTRFIWNAPYAEVYAPGIPASGRALEITAGVWGEDRGKDSTDIALGLIGDPVVPATLSISLTDNQICAGEALSVPFAVAGGPFQFDNQFKLELSQPNGSFINPTVLATIAGSGGGNFDFTLPAGTPSGTGYRMRVVSTAPVYSGTSVSLFVGAAATPSGINGTARICPSETGVVLSAAGSLNGTAFNWTLPAGASFASPDSLRQITVNFGPEAGSVSVSARNSCGVSSAFTKTLNLNTASFIFNAGNLIASAPGAVAYAWYLNDNIIPGANGSTYQFTEGGVYCVEATFSSGCKVKSECQAVTANAAMLKAFDGLTVFPNPAAGKLNVHVASGSDFTGEVVIRNMMGQHMAQISGSELSTLDVKSWPAGIYVVSATLKSGGSAQKQVQVNSK